MENVNVFFGLCVFSTMDRDLKFLLPKLYVLPGTLFTTNCSATNMPLSLIWNKNHIKYKIISSFLQKCYFRACLFWNLVSEYWSLKPWTGFQVKCGFPQSRLVLCINGMLVKKTLPEARETECSSILWHNLVISYLGGILRKKKFYKETWDLPHLRVLQCKLCSLNCYSVWTTFW